jgi:hypothetical protein
MPAMAVAIWVEAARAPEMAAATTAAAMAVVARAAAAGATGAETAVEMAAETVAAMVEATAAEAATAGDPAPQTNRSVCNRTLSAGGPLTAHLSPVLAR